MIRLKDLCHRREGDEGSNKRWERENVEESVIGAHSAFDYTICRNKRREEGKWKWGGIIIRKTKERRGKTRDDGECICDVRERRGERRRGKPPTKDWSGIIKQEG